MLDKVIFESGVAGAERVKSRADFAQFLRTYEQLLKQFPGVVGFKPSGSYNSNLAKQDFGDIDLIVHIKSDKDKATVKKELQAFFTRQPDTVIVPFSSEKHAGKRTYNAGELVSVRYHDDTLGYSAQIDNIIALDQSEASFKQEFLDMPAEKQGLVLGLVKIATIETDPQVLFKNLGITAPPLTQPNEEYEFNLSSVEIQLRKITYKPGTYEQVAREVLWTSRNFDDLKKILYQYDLSADFDKLLAQAKATIKNPRSNNRMQGVFSSMITVKSGEVGTAKGAGKEQALAKIQQTFRESRSIFRALLEAGNKKVVFAFGRFQPPTIGHELLINTVKQIAAQTGSDYVIYVSKTQDAKTNPLDVGTKIAYLKKMFPGTNFAAADATIRTPIEAVKHLNQTYNELIWVAGSDRVPTFEKLLNDYNGKEYQYQNLQVVSSGDRDPDSEGTEGMSGTKMRAAAVEGNLEAFRQGLPSSLGEEDAMNLMNLIRTGLTKPTKAKKGVAEADQLPGTPVVSLKDLDDKDTKKNRYGQTVPKKLKQDDPRVKFHKDPKQGVAEVSDDKQYHGWGEYEYEIKAKAGKVAEYLHELNPELFSRYGDEFLMNVAEKITAENPEASLTQIASNVIRAIKKEVEEGLAGTLIGGGAGALLTKTPSGAMLGARLGNKVQDIMSKEETSPMDLSHGSGEKLKQDPDYRRDVKDAKQIKAQRAAIASRVKKGYGNEPDDFNEAMLPKSAFAGSNKNKLGPAAHLKGSMKRPARQGDLVGGAAESIERKSRKMSTGQKLDRALQRGGFDSAASLQRIKDIEAKYKKPEKKEVKESNELKGTLRTIVNDIGEPVAAVYETLKHMAQRFYQNKGELKGFGMIAGGVGSRWYQTHYFNKLQNELHDLCKQVPRHTVELQKFLRGREVDGVLEPIKSFNVIGAQLPGILANIGKKIGYEPLIRNAERWIKNKNTYEEFLDRLELEPDEDDDYDDSPAPAPKDPTMGKQRSQADEIVNDVLRKLPSKVAGDIRNAIARSPNKLQALQQELQRRGVKVPMEGVVKGLSWSSLDEGLSVEDKIVIFEEYAIKGNLTESIDDDKKDYFISLFKLSDTPIKNKKYIVVPLSIVSNKIMQLDAPAIMKFLGQSQDGLVFNTNNGRKTYPSKTMRDLSIFNTFTFASKSAYDKFRIALLLKFDINLPSVDDESQGVAEGWDPDTTRLEQDVRDALDNGDDYTAKQYAKMAPTPEAKKYLLNIIKQAMYIDDLGGETDWKGVAEAGKIKGADGKACWKGKRYAGTENGKDKCVPISEDAESIMASLIEQILINDTKSNKQLNELYSYQSDKNYIQYQPYKRYNTFVSRKKFNNLYFIAVAENPRTLEAVHKEKGNTQEEALKNLMKKIDQEIDVATKVSGNATIDFNVDFVREILEMSTDRFYAKIISGPTLVIAGPEMMEYPEIMQSEGFKGSSIRSRNTPEGAAQLPSIPLSAKAAKEANLIANGRYVLGNETIDKDGNRVFELNFDSVVADPREKVRMRAPSITIGTNR